VRLGKLLSLKFPPPTELADASPGVAHIQFLSQDLCQGRLRNTPDLAESFASAFFPIPTLVRKGSVSGLFTGPMLLAQRCSHLQRCTASDAAPLVSPQPARDRKTSIVPVPARRSSHATSGLVDQPSTARLPG